MIDSNQKSWPFKPRTSIISSILILFGLIFILVVLRLTIKWPAQESETVVFIGVFILSLLPVIFALLNVIIERGGTIKFKDIEINFAQPSQKGLTGFTIPVNIGAPGEPIQDLNSTRILDALKTAAACDIVVIDLEEGSAWWETRLLILLAGAVRLGKPEKLVFIGTDNRIENCFQGWGYPTDLLRCILQQGDSRYILSYQQAMSAALQWQMVEPVGANITPPTPSWIQPGLATQYSWTPFDQSSGLHNVFHAEQMLALKLGEKIESQEPPRWVNLGRMENLFRPVLYKDSIDESWPPERQINAFFESNANYIAVTQNGQYKSMLSRLTVLSAMVKTIVAKK